MIPMGPIPILGNQDVIEKIKTSSNPYWPQYFSFYSSWFGGIIKDPGPWLLAPLDDHQFHRGDGVFEAIKTKNRKIFMLEPHLQRLLQSATKIGIKLPYSLKEIENIILQTLQAADQPNTLIRLFVSRGPGGFTVNPYDSISAQLYVVVTRLNEFPEQKYQEGVSLGRSEIPIKEGKMPQIKSCNYLPNVLMKKESVDRKLDFTASFDDEGFLAESATENIVLVDANGILTGPPFEKILAGTTLLRCFKLAETLNMATGFRKLSESDVLSAREVIMMGTTLDVMPVTTYEGHKISNGQVGSVSKKLRQLLVEDMKNGLIF